MFTGTQYRDNVRIKIIEYLQVHPIEGFFYEENELERAAEISLEIENELNNICKTSLSEY